MTKPSDHAINFEAVKVSLRQDKNGYALVLAIHPDDVPDALFRSLVGSRYVVAMVGVDDHEQPIPLVHPQRQSMAPQEGGDGATDAGRSAVAYAGSLCREPMFQEWLVDQGHASQRSEAAAAGALRRLLGVASRAELATNVGAQRMLGSIANDYLKD